MSEREDIINVKLADILSSFGINAKAERTGGRRRPDIRCYYKGLIIGIEASCEKSDAERDAEEKIKQGLADITLALWIKRCFRDIPETELTEAIRSSKFDVRVFIPIEIEDTLLQLKGIKTQPATEWIEDIDLPTVKTIIENSAAHLIREEEIQMLIKRMRSKIIDFINSLKKIDSSGVIRRKIYDVLYKLYGLSITETGDPDIAFSHAALSILLSTVFYEHIRDTHPELKPITNIEGNNYIKELIEAFEALKTNYRVAVNTTLDILNVLPPGIDFRVRDLVNLAAEMASNRDLLREDFAGRVYHRITGDIILRKSFSTFYTEVPAAYLLATLAIQMLLGLDEKELFNIKGNEARSVVHRIKSVKICDFACGSGTLLTASYYSFHRIAAMLKYYYDLQDLDLEEVDKKLVEEGIYGIDALRYASQITAINLALMGPSISKENVYSIYLGYIPGKDLALLGSLELLNSRRVGGLLSFMDGGLKEIAEGVRAEGVSLEGTEGEFSIPDKFDMIIMNPPFIRAGGSVNFNEKIGGLKGKGIFGFIADENARKKVLKAHEDVRNIVRDGLKSIAKAIVDTPDVPDIIKHLVRDEPEEIRQYLFMGQAGESPLFLYLAYKYIENGGIIAFVLPRGLLSGESWLLIRTLLISKFHVKYIAISSDSEKGYNFSEGSSISETLLVARRVDEHSDDEETVFINLLRKPSSALEAIMLAEEVKKAAFSGNSNLVEVGESKALVYKVRREELLNHIENWNKLVALPDIELLTSILNLLDYGELPYMKTIVPLTLFNNLIDSIGNTRLLRVYFERIGTETPYPALYGGNEKVRMKMLVRFNTYAHPKIDRAKSIFENYRSKVLIPNEIAWSTAHAIALYSREPLIANIFFTVKLRIADNIREYAEKAIVLWLNTTWGLLTVLINRHDRGELIQLDIARWRLLRVLDVASLDNDTLKMLADIFDKYAEKPLRRIPEQFNPEDPDPVRLGIDKDFIKVFNPSIDEKRLENDLRELYRHVDIALRLWMKSGQ
jgi:hypothetical protein